MLEDLQRALQDAGIVGIYKTTTLARGHRTDMPHDAVCCAMFPCFNASWDPGYEAYWDRLHFKPVVFHQLNQQLLKMVDGLES